MKQFILTITFSLATIASSLAQEKLGNNISAEKSDTLYSYNIDGSDVKHFTGKELEGKTIKQYDIRHTFVPEDKVVIESHIIKTTTPPKPRTLAPIYIVDGKEISNKEFDSIYANKIESISVLKAGSKAALEYGKDGDKRGYVIIKMKR